MPDPLYSGRYTQAFPITPSDTQRVAGPRQADGRPLPYCNGIHIIASGNITATFKDDLGNGPVTFPVNAGIIYPYSLTYVWTTTTATLLGLV